MVDSFFCGAWSILDVNVGWPAREMMGFMHSLLLLNKVFVIITS